MTTSPSLALRAAARIHDFLLTPRPATTGLPFPTETLERCQRIVRQVRKAESKRWFAAARRLRREFPMVAIQLTEELQGVAREVARSHVVRVAHRRDIFNDLRALGNEFDKVEIQMREATIRARTGPIELEREYLGPFDIVLHWSRIGNSQPYDVIAVDPRRADSNDSVTHPHVQDDSLCEGEARNPIKNSLLEGRLFDFFLIVRQTLETYNSSSAFVRLNEWNGRRCADCDVYDDDPYVCENCGVNVCEECSSSCERCNFIACSECKTYCDACDQPTCSSCLEPCAGCGASTCEECLTDGNCPDCRNQESETETGGAEPAGAAQAENPIAGAAV